MKLKTGIILMLGGLMMASPAFTQDAGPDKDRQKRRPGPPGMRQGGGPGERGPGFHKPGQPGKNRRPLENYMERLKQSDPEAFEELKRLKAEDPEAFKEKLNQRLSHGRFKDRFKDFPEMAAVFERMPEERRREMMGRFMMRGGPDGERKGDDEARREKWAASHQAFTDLANAYKEAPDDASREAIRSKVAQHVTTFFNERQDERRKHIERIRAELGKMEQMMGADEAKRSEMIQRRVEDILSRYGKSDSEE